MAPRREERPAAKSGKTTTVDAYLAAAPKDQRAALTKLRRTIKARLAEIERAR